MSENVNPFGRWDVSFNLFLDKRVIYVFNAGFIIEIDFLGSWYVLNNLNGVVVEVDYGFLAAKIMYRNGVGDRADVGVWNSLWWWDLDVHVGNLATSEWTTEKECGGDVSSWNGREFFTDFSLSVCNNLRGFLNCCSHGSRSRYGKCWRNSKVRGMTW